MVYTFKVHYLQITNKHVPQSYCTIALSSRNVKCVKKKQPLATIEEWAGHNNQLYYQVNSQGGKVLSCQPADLLQV